MDQLSLIDLQIAVALTKHPCSHFNSVLTAVGITGRIKELAARLSATAETALTEIPGADGRGSENVPSCVSSNFHVALVLNSYKQSDSIDLTLRLMHK